MPAQTEKRGWFWAGLAAITIVYCLYYLFFIYGLAREIPLRARHFFKFLFIITAYGVGWMAWRKNPASWLRIVWNGVYLTALLLLVLFGIYDWAIARTPYTIRIVADDIQELLVSPILYVGLALVKGKLAS